MIHFNRSGFDFQCPTCWADLTIEQLLAVYKNKMNPLERLEVLSGIDKYSWSQCQDLEIDYFLSEPLKFLDSEFDLQDYFVPDFITISGIKYQAPKGIAINSFGQKLALENCIREAEERGESEIDCYPYLLALYMQPIVTGGDYNNEEVDKLLPQVMKCQLREAWPLCAFFLSNYEKFCKENMTRLAISRALKSTKQELKSLRYSVNFRHFSPWRRATLWLLIKYYLLIMPQSMPSYLQRLRPINSRED